MRDRQRLEKKILRKAGRAIADFKMIAEGDRVLVALSGGKDSYTLLAVLHELQWRGLLPVDILACNLDQGQPGFPKHVLPEFLASLGVEHRIITEDTRDEMAQILYEIQSGEFAREWILENQAGRPVFNAHRRMHAEHPIEEVGKKLRSMMGWLKK